MGRLDKILTSAASWAGRSEVNALLAMMGDRTGSWRDVFSGGGGEIKFATALETSVFWRLEDVAE